MMHGQRKHKKSILEFNVQMMPWPLHWVQRTS